MTSNKNSKPKPVIQKIKFSKAELEEIGRINKHEKVTRTKIITRKDGSQYVYKSTRALAPELAKKRLTELYGRLCTICGVVWPDYRVVYDVGDDRGGAKLIERYCQSCFHKWKENNKKK